MCPRNLRGQYLSVCLYTTHSFRGESTNENQGTNGNCELFTNKKRFQNPHVSLFHCYCNPHIRQWTCTTSTSTLRIPQQYHGSIIISKECAAASDNLMQIMQMRIRYKSITLRFWRHIILEIHYTQSDMTMPIMQMGSHMPPLCLAESLAQWLSHFYVQY